MALGGVGWAWEVASASYTRRPPARRRRSPAFGATAASRQAEITALHRAAYSGQAPCVESLLKAGADASLEDKVSDGA